MDLMTQNSIFVPKRKTVNGVKKNTYKNVSTISKKIKSLNLMYNIHP